MKAKYFEAGFPPLPVDSAALCGLDEQTPPKYFEALKSA
jgi:hypothetical protein